MGFEGKPGAKTQDILSNEIPSIKLSKAEKFERAMKNIFDKKVDNANFTNIQLFCNILVVEVLKSQNLEVTFDCQRINDIHASHLLIIFLNALIICLKYFCE